MTCPHCNATDMKVVDSRNSGYLERRRRRACLKCGYRITTYEITRDVYRWVRTSADTQLTRNITRGGKP